MSHWLEVSAATAAAIGTLVVLWKYLVKAWKGWRALRAKSVAITDSILGREAVVDSITGKEIAPALPGMGVRMARWEQQLEALTSVVTQLAKQNEMFVEHDHRITAAERRLDAVEAASVERVVAKAESAAAWRAVEAVAKADPAE